MGRPVNLPLRSPRAMSSAASAPVSAPSGPSFTSVCMAWSNSTAWSSGSRPTSIGAISCTIIPNDARPPCIGDASPRPIRPSSVWTRTKALRWLGLSAGDQLTWNASILVIFMSAAFHVLAFLEEHIFPTIRLAFQPSDLVHERGEIHHLHRDGGISDIRIGHPAGHLRDTGMLVAGHRQVNLRRLAWIGMNEIIRLLLR